MELTYTADVTDGMETIEDAFPDFLRMQVIVKTNKQTYTIHITDIEPLLAQLYAGNDVSAKQFKSLKFKSYDDALHYTVKHKFHIVPWIINYKLKETD